MTIQELAVRIVAELFTHGLVEVSDVKSVKAVVEKLLLENEDETV